jgi:hypothetical protein
MQRSDTILLEKIVALKANTLRDAEDRENLTADNIHRGRSKFHLPSPFAKIVVCNDVFKLQQI